MNGDERADVERLRRYWDGVVQGTPTDAADLDAATAAVVHHLHAFYQPPLPDTAFRHHLQEKLMGAAAWPPVFSADSPVRHAPSLATGPNGWSESRSQALPPPSRGLPSRGRVFSRLTTAVFLLLSLGLGLGTIAFHRGVPLAPRHASVILAALEGTPATSLPGVIEDTVLFQQVLEDIPDDAHSAEVDRFTAPPGTTWRQGTATSNGVGPMLYRVESGAVTVQVDGPAQVTRAGAGDRVPITPTTAIALAVGDGIFLPSGVASQWRTTSRTPATILDIGHHGRRGSGVDHPHVRLYRPP